MIDLKNFDIHSSMIMEGGSLYSNIFKFDKNLFNQWCIDNFEYYGEVHTFEEAEPSEIQFSNFQKLGYQHLNSACHYSANAISLLDSNYKSITGFIITQLSPSPLITHSFNFFDNQIIDFSRYLLNDSFTSRDKDGLPHKYFGIELPIKFLKKYEDEILDKTMNPLLYEFCRECNLFW